MSDDTRAPKIPCHIVNLGVAEYDKALNLQTRLRQERIEGAGRDTVLLLQHPPVIALGRAGSRQDILVSDDFIAEKGIAIAKSDRCGDIAFHNPGQLIAYGIFSLAVLDTSIHRYIRGLEEVVLGTLSDFGIAGRSLRGYPGLWVGEDNICSLGLSVSRRVTMHGFALNVNNGLEYLSYMHPRGIWGRGVTSMSRVLQMDITVDQVVPSLVRNLSSVFNLEIDYRSGDVSTIDE